MVDQRRVYVIHDETGQIVAASFMEASDSESTASKAPKAHLEPGSLSHRAVTVEIPSQGANVILGELMNSHFIDSSSGQAKLVEKRDQE